MTADMRTRRRESRGRVAHWAASLVLAAVGACGGGAAVRDAARVGDAPSDGANARVDTLVSDDARVDAPASGDVNDGDSDGPSPAGDGAETRDAGDAADGARDGGTSDGGQDAGASDGGQDAGASDDASNGASDACEVRCLDVPRSLELAGARHAVADRARGLVYVTMPSVHPTYPNSVVIVDPLAPSVKTSLAVGAEPNLLALSDDASRLWVGIDGDHALRSIDLTSDPPVVGVEHPLPQGANYPYPTTAGALAILRGSASSVVVSLSSTTDFHGVVVLDDGVARGPAVYRHISSLVAGRSPDVYGIDGFVSSFDFYTLEPTSTGFSSTLAPKTPFTMDVSRAVFSDDFLYASSGDVVDVHIPSAPVRYGSFPFFGEPLPVPGSTKVLLLSTIGAPTGALRAMDTSNLAPRKTVTLDGVREGQLWDLDRVGTNTVVFLAADKYAMPPLPGRLVVVNTSLLP